MTVYTSTQLTTDSGDRQGVKPSLIVLHHTAFVGSIQSLINLMMPGGRTVSAHAAIRDNHIVNVVPESRRSWSLGAAVFERRVLSAECINSTGGPSWSLSDATHESIARWVADVCKRHGIRPHREGPSSSWTVIGHREVFTIHRAGYATACPGGMRMDWIVARAQQLLAPPPAPVAPTTRKESEMYLYRETSGTIGLMTSQGLVGISAGEHVLLFQRVFSSYPGFDTFTAAETEIMAGYIRAAATTDAADTQRILTALAAIRPVVDVDALTGPIVDAVRGAIAAQGVKVDLAPVLAAVTAATESINANVDQIPLGFTITAK